MILTVTINPLIERRFHYREIDLNSVNRNGSFLIQAGGKGINVSRQLNCLSVNNLAFTFTGSHNGRDLKEALEREKINFSAIRTAADNREAAVLIDENNLKVYSFFSADPEITSAEAEEFKLKLDKMIRNCEIVIFSGSSPSPETDSIFSFGIAAANKYDKISVCDTYGNHLKECIENSPTILHNNLKEIKESLKLPAGTELEKIEILNHMHSKGIKQVYLTDGSSDTYASNFDYHYKVVNADVKEIDATGSGDSFVSGIVYGWHKDMTFEETLAFASALGSVNACKLETCRVNFEEIKELKDKIKIIPVGKKMKIIDVTPT